MDPEEEGRQAAMMHYWSSDFICCLVAGLQRMYRKDA
jgi:hypothetical protein